MPHRDTTSETPRARVRAYSARVDPRKTNGSTSQHAPPLALLRQALCTTRGLEKQGAASADRRRRAPRGSRQPRVARLCACTPHVAGPPLSRQEAPINFCELRLAAAGVGIGTLDPRQSTSERAARYMREQNPRKWRYKVHRRRRHLAVAARVKEASPRCRALPVGRGVWRHLGPKMSATAPPAMVPSLSPFLRRNHGQMLLAKGCQSTAETKLLMRPTRCAV